MLGTAAALALAGGLGAAKTASDAARNKAQRKLQGETTRYSPWTGMQAAAPQGVDALGNFLSSGATALTMNQLNPAAAAPAGQVGLGGTLTNGSPWAGMSPKLMAPQQGGFGLGRGSPWMNA